MAVAGAPSVVPPTPEECDHPAPVEGVLAHEFAHYEGALGPEGKRRTVTYYGPVIGGLPIRAWHCETCGLLRLVFPDGRREERRLFPGPQPGLLAPAAAVAPEQELYGLQPRVSGLTAQPTYFASLLEETGFGAAAPALRLPQVTLPAWDAVTWLTVLGLSSVLVMLLLTGILAVYTFSTPSAVAPLAVTAALTFTGVALLRIGAAAVRHFFPVQTLSPSVAETLREQPALDAATRAAVTLLTLSVIGLFTAGLLAVYTFATPGAEGPVIILSIVFGLLALLVKVGSAAWRHFTGG
ncbi:MAG: hypothetical protein JOZ46_04240 [Candidatus Dormibacteraeota bacterium]|nr:hypothetical protein [Candidatus Dormibacteraeota bacterium]MBV9525009.1 hypothetical protein [Candidatus Dormibacteraeota bacterium]